METPIGDDEDSHLGDFIEDGNASVPDRLGDRHFGQLDGVHEFATCCARAHSA